MNDFDIFANAPQMRGRGLTAVIGRLVLALAGWKRNVPAGLPQRCVIIVYPHTSNWDFPIGLMCKWAAGLEVNYLGKDSLFRSPLGGFFRATGGIPVDRAHPHGLMQAMVALFQLPGATRLVIAPEGTRKFVPTLKTGFYRIALAAGVPVVCATIDYATRRVGVLQTLTLTGDPTVDVDILKEIYRPVRGKRPECMGRIGPPAERVHE